MTSGVRGGIPIFNMRGWILTSPEGRTLIFSLRGGKMKSSVTGEILIFSLRGGTLIFNVRGEILTSQKG